MGQWLEQSKGATTWGGRVGEGPDTPPPPTSRVTPNFWDRFFLGGPFWGSVTRGVGTIMCKSLQCTNHHVEPAFRCKIVVDFQYVPRTLPRRSVSLLKPVDFFVGYDNDQNYRIRRKKIFGVPIWTCASFRSSPSLGRIILGPPTFRSWLRPWNIHDSSVIVVCACCQTETR
jgi:hypothetical protein